MSVLIKSTNVIASLTAQITSAATPASVMRVTMDLVRLIKYYIIRIIPFSLYVYKL